MHCYLSTSILTIANEDRSIVEQSLKHLVLQEHPRNALGWGSVDQCSQGVSIGSWHNEISDLGDHLWMCIRSPFSITELHIFELGLGGNLRNDIPCNPVVANCKKTPLARSSRTMKMSFAVREKRKQSVLEQFNYALPHSCCHHR